MLCASSLDNGSIVEIDLLWPLCLVVVGPVILIPAVLVLMGGIAHRSLSRLKLTAALFAICSVIVWTFGFWTIGELLRPVFFSLVAGENERLAIAFRQQHPAGEEARVRGFRGQG